MTIADLATDEMVKILTYGSTDDVLTYREEIKKSVIKLAQLIKQIT